MVIFGIILELVCEEIVSNVRVFSLEVSESMLSTLTHPAK